MRVVRVFIATALAAVVLNAGSAFAQEEVTDEVKELVAKWVDIHALVSTTYLYSFERPAGRNIPARVIDKKSETFALNDAALFFGRQREDEDFGFMIDMDFGHAAQNTGSDWDGSGAVGDGNNEEGDAFELREAYLTYKLPFAGITAKGGKFVTLLGYEVLKGWASFNHNISHSILFGYTIPFTHTGLVFNIPLGDMFALDLGVVNGWDNVDDNNSGKTFLGGFKIAPADIISMYAAGTYGTEAAADGTKNGSSRGVFTFNTVLTATEQLKFIADFVYGSQSNQYIQGNGDDDGFTWYGMAGYIVFDLNEQWGFALRGEVYNDDIRRNFGGIVNNNGGQITIWEVTPTVAFRLNDHIMLRAEYRHDDASRSIFVKPANRAGGTSGYGDSWNTIHAEVLVGF
jgi:hypothetical protein